MISFAAGEIAGSAGKETGLLTILYAILCQIMFKWFKDNEEMRNEIHTVCKSLLGLNAKRVDIL